MRIRVFMNSVFRCGLAVVGAALTVALIVPAAPARTQDRGSSVVVTNTPAEPVPAHIVKRSSARRSSSSIMPQSVSGD